MEKKLPSVYANKIDKKLDNNKKVYYSKNNAEEIDVKKAKKSIVEPNINQKIKNIFSSVRYVYKADVDITLKSGKVKKKIVGKNNTHLITIENELIPISDIIDIEFSN